MAGPMAGPPVPPSYKEKGDLGPEFGIPMPPPPNSVYEPPPSYKPAASVYSDARSVASGHTTRYAYQFSRILLFIKKSISMELKQF